MDHEHVCKTCHITFINKKKSSQYCCHQCYANRFGTVTNTCVICGQQFNVAYRFRATKTCGPGCRSKLASQISTKRPETHSTCEACGKRYKITHNDSHYCSYQCFLTTRKTRQPDVTKQCENCGKQFVVPFTKMGQRFCSNRCIPRVGNFAPGERNPNFGKPSWNHGLTKYTDDRVKRLGDKISVQRKEQFANGTLSHKGIKNPNLGKKPPSFPRDNYSKAAVHRLTRRNPINSRYITGVYDGVKSQGSVAFRSSWELAAMMWWERQENIDSYRYECMTLTLSDGRRTIPDFVVYYTNGDRILYEIKPSALQIVSPTKEKLDMTRQLANELGLRYELLGDAEIHKMIKELGDEFVEQVSRYKRQ